MSESNSKKYKLRRPINLICILTLFIDSALLSYIIKQNYFLILISALLVYVALYAFFEKRRFSYEEDYYEENSNDTQGVQSPKQTGGWNHGHSDFNVIKSAMFTDTDTQSVYKNKESDNDNPWRSLYNKNDNKYETLSDVNDEYKKFIADQRKSNKQDAPKSGQKGFFEEYAAEPIKKEGTVSFEKEESSDKAVEHLFDAVELESQTFEIQSQIDDLINGAKEDSHNSTSSKLKLFNKKLDNGINEEKIDYDTDYDGITSDTNLIDKLYADRTEDFGFAAESLNDFSSSITNEVKYDDTADKIINILKNSGVEAEIIDIKHGAAFSNYEIKPVLSSNLNKIRRMGFELELKLSSGAIRVGDIYSDTATINIEVPNMSRTVPRFSELIKSSVFVNSDNRIKCILGTDVNNDTIYLDLRKIPHLLVAGASAKEKNMCLNVLILSILAKKDGSNINLLIIDISNNLSGRYNGLPNLCKPVINSKEYAVSEMESLLSLIDMRLNLFSEQNVNDIYAYNKSRPDNKLSQIVVFISELADVISYNRKYSEKLICNLIQKSRSAGIYLVIGTVDCSNNVLTDLIKVNIPSRITFKLRTEEESLSVIDISGAEKLLGSGDMLYYPKGSVTPKRLQCAFISDEEINTIINS